MSGSAPQIDTLCIEAFVWKNCGQKIRQKLCSSVLQVQYGQSGHEAMQESPLPSSKHANPL